MTPPNIALTLYVIDCFKEFNYNLEFEPLCVIDESYTSQHFKVIRFKKRPRHVSPVDYYLKYSGGYDGDVYQHSYVKIKKKGREPRVLKIHLHEPDDDIRCQHVILSLYRARGFKETECSIRYYRSSKRGIVEGQSYYELSRILRIRKTKHVKSLYIDYFIPAEGLNKSLCDIMLKLLDASWNLKNVSNGQAIVINQNNEGYVLDMYRYASFAYIFNDR